MEGKPQDAAPRRAKKLRQQDTRAVEDARVALDRAATRYRTSTREDDGEIYDEAMRYYKETVTRTSQYNQDIAVDVHATNAEKSTKHFFCPLDTSLWRVSIEEFVICLDQPSRDFSPLLGALGFRDGRLQQSGRKGSST